MKILITTLVLMSTLFAEIKVGEFFPKLTLVDQFNKKTEVKKKGSTTLLLSFEKDVSADIKTYLGAKEKGFLVENDMMYISDISSMPSFITRMFALPKMKKFTFKVSLIYDEKEATSINRQKGKVTVVRLKDNRIQKVTFIVPKELGSVLK